MVTFLTKETREAGFAKELETRVLAAWRRDPEKALAAKRPTFETRDPLLLALTAWVGPGLPEAKPARGVTKGEKILDIREFAEELRKAEPTFEVPVPKGVLCCVRRGEWGKNSIVFFNLTDEEKAFDPRLPKDLPTKFIDLYTGKVWSCEIHVLFGFKLEPRGYRILRSNSGMPGRDAPDDDEIGISLDE